MGERGGEREVDTLYTTVNSVHAHSLTHLIFSHFFGANVSCSKLPLWWLNFRTKRDGVRRLKISTQSFLYDHLGSIKHLGI